MKQAHQRVTKQNWKSIRTNDYTDVNETSDKSQGLRPSSLPKHGVMRGHQPAILLAALVLIAPMLVLTVVLISLILTHLMPENGSTYSIGDQKGLPLGPAYYVNYSATRLVFISSVSSTMAPFLISAAMYLYSYPLALSLARSSDSGIGSKLPSPYQLHLIIGAIDARLKSLWSILRYICTSRRKRVSVVPDLWKGFGMLLALAFLA